MLSTLIEHLGKEFNLSEKISSKSPDEYSIAFDAINIVVIKSFAEGFYWISSSIAPIPEQNKENFYNLILEANLFGQATRGSVLGLNADENVLTLSQELDYNSTDQDFKEKIEDFLNIADFWRKKTSEF